MGRVAAARVGVVEAVGAAGGVAPLAGAVDGDVAPADGDVAPAGWPALGWLPGDGGVTVGGMLVFAGEAGDGS